MGAIRHLDAAGLETWPLLSGGKGVHVVVPLDCTNSRAEVETFCKLFAKRMEADQPKLFVANMSIAKRQGKIFVDYLRNRNKATAILPWSVRARPGASIAAPVSWNILNRAHSARDYHIANLPDKKHWAGFWAARQKISKEVLKLLAG